MSQIQNQWDEVTRIETELKQKLVAMNIDWNDDGAMTQLAAECKTFGSTDLQAAYQSHDRMHIVKAEFFALVSLMLTTMENAAGDDRDVHAGSVWKAFGRHLYA